MPSESRVNRSGIAFLSASAVWTAAALVYSLRRATVHDYHAYLDQWANILAGGDPWEGSMPARNAYGPLHNLLAALTPIHPLAPKVFMVGCFLAVNMLITWRLVRDRPDIVSMLLYMIFVPLNACVLVWGIAYGDNDILVAALVGLALLARLDKRLVLSGLLLGAAVLLKLYPAVLIPFFALDRRTFSLRMVITAGVTISIGFGLSVLVWGNNTFSSFLFASQREASLNSMWLLADTGGRLPGLDDIFNFAVTYNSAIVLIVLTMWFVLTWLWSTEWLPSSVIGLLLAFLVYKVGHGQFFVSWLVLVSGLLLFNQIRYRGLAFACVPAALGVSAVALIFDLQQEFGALTGLSPNVPRLIVAGTGFTTTVVAIKLIFRQSRVRTHNKTMTR